MTQTRKAHLARLALTLLVGCAHASPVSDSPVTDTSESASPEDPWTGRIGKYSYEQALGELGPPAQHRDLAGGETVCTWPRKRTGAEYRPPETSYGTIATGIPDDDVVILTFDSRKVLINCVTKPTPPKPK